MKNKKCSLCGTTKSVLEFGKNRSKKDGLQNYCKLCSKEKDKKYYYSSKGNRTKKRYNEDRREKVREYIYSYLKETGCIDCGIDNPIVLEFDHVRDKTYTIASMIRLGLSLDSIKKEMKKCEVRCSNCHKIKTAKQFGWYKKQAPVV